MALKREKEIPSSVELESGMGFEGLFRDPAKIKF
jgi:hypothetical protein